MAITMIRTIIIFLAIVISMRLMGKRQLGELEPAELVVAVLISDLASQPLQDPGTPLIYGLIPVITLFCCEILISAGIMNSLKFRSLVCGRPSMIIDNGKIVQKEMQKNRFTLDELAEELRKKDILDISTVQYAVLETDGTLSTILYPTEAPLTPKMLKLEVENARYPVILINDGKVLAHNLRAIGRDENWLHKQITAKGAKSFEDVYIMTADSSDNIFFAMKEVS